jgi:hypothetical protein
MKLTFLILGIPAAVLIFLPFAHGVSPFLAATGLFKWSSRDTLEFHIGLLGIPFFSALLVLAWKVRSWLPTPVKTAEIVAGYCLAALTISASVLFVVSGITESGAQSRDDWIALSIVSVLTFVCITLLIVNICRHAPGISNVHLALLSAYIPNAVLCLWGFSDFWQTGAYLALFAVIVNSTEIAFITARKWATQAPSA